ncbi:MAG: ABC transporter permease [Actinobacteria bacterium]|nr:ABC transporter permease [Actinomycetota bacterium]
MEFVTDLIQWFPDNMWGDAGIIVRTIEHIQISAFSVVVAAVFAIPPAMFLAHRRIGAFTAVTAVNIGRAIPSFGVLALALPITIIIARNVPFLSTGLGFFPTFVALFVLALPPMFANTYTGIAGVDADLVEAARGMGLTSRQILIRIELPVAAPLIVEGIRLSTVQVIATATLGALVAFDGLGRFVINGFSGQDTTQLAGGAILVGLLAIAAELFFAAYLKWGLPRGIRDGVR